MPVNPPQSPGFRRWESLVPMNPMRPALVQFRVKPGGNTADIDSPAGGHLEVGFGGMIADMKSGMLGMQNTAGGLDT